MDYAGTDSMTLRGLHQPNSIELANVVENFTVIIQSRHYVILTNDTVFPIWMLSLPNCGENHVRNQDKSNLKKVIKAAKHCPLQAPWCFCIL